MGSNRSASLIVAMGFVLATGLIVLSRAPLSGIFAIFLVLVLPGYGLVRLVFMRRGLGLAESLLLTAGLSMAVVALMGLWFTAVPWGLQTGALVVGLTGFSLAALLLAWMRRKRISITRPRPERFRMRLQDGVILAAAAGVLVAGVLIARQPAPAQVFQGYTLLWAVPYEPGGTGAFKVVVRSQEFTPLDYHLRFEVGGRVVAATQVFQLQPGETLEQVEVFSGAQPGERPVEISLYRVDAPTQAYRRVLLWVEE